MSTRMDRRRACGASGGGACGLVATTEPCARKMLVHPSYFPPRCEKVCDTEASPGQAYVSDGSSCSLGRLSLPPPPTSG